MSLTSMRSSKNDSQKEAKGLSDWKYTVMKFAWYAIGAVFAIVYLVSLVSSAEFAEHKLIECFLKCIAIASIISVKDEI